LFTLAALAGSVLVYLILPILALRWAQLPFVGAFVEPTLVFNGVGPQGSTPWSGIDAALRFPYRLTSIDSAPIRNTADLTDVLATRRPGEQAVLTYLDENGLEQQAIIALQPFPIPDLFAYFIVPYLIGLAYLTIGARVYRSRREDAAGRAFALFCAATAIVVGGLFDLYTTHVFAWVWTLALALVPGALLTLSLVFPQEIGFVSRYPVLRWLGFIPAGILAGLGERALYATPSPTAYADA